MIATLCLSAFLLFQAGIPPVAKQGGTPARPLSLTVSSQTNTASGKDSAPADIDAELAQKLLRVKRIYVDRFGDDPVSQQTQAMVINALTATKKFIITENKDKADAVLRGTALEKTSQELHASSEGTAVAAASGGHSGSVGGSFAGGTGTVSGSSSGGFAAHSAAINDSQASTETINDARVAVRLVSSDGDVIWSSTQESIGAKYKGASADVADKVVKQLLRDVEKLQNRASDNKP